MSMMSSTFARKHKHLNLLRELRPSLALGVAEVIIWRKRNPQGLLVLLAGQAKTGGQLLQAILLPPSAHISFEEGEIFGRAIAPRWDPVTEAAAKLSGEFHSGLAPLGKCC